MSRIASTLSLVIGTALLGTVWSANATIADCTGCSMPQIEAMAPFCQDSGGHIGGRYISDFASGNLYNVCYTLRDTQPYISSAAPERAMQHQKIYHWNGTEALIQNQFQAYYNVYRYNGHVRAQDAAVKVYANLQPKIGLGADDGYMNAYDTVVATANKDAVVDWLQTTMFTTQNVSNIPDTYPFSPTLTAAIADLLNTVKLGIVSFDFNVKITLQFHDGSTRDFTIDSTGNWTSVPNSAKDAHGNPIPETAKAVANNGGRETYNFKSSGPSYDLNNFLISLKAFGIPIDNGTNGNSEVFTCSWNEATSTISCTRLTETKQQ